MSRLYESSASVSAGGSGSGSGGHKRRRVPAVITPNACTNCKKARAKCDGEKPSCTRCLNRGQEATCIYETHLKTAKEEMVRVIRVLEEKNNYVEQIFRALKAGGNGRDVITRLRNGESYRDIAESQVKPFSNIFDLSPSSESRLSRVIKDYEIDSAKGRDPGSGVIEGGGWTNVSSDETLIDHLFALYFTWVHPVHMVFSRPHFLAAFRNRADLYCTSALVNAICAMACHLLDTSVDPGLTEETDPGTLREEFMAEARSLLKIDPNPSMPVIQTYAVMFMVDLGSGKGQRASSYIRLAADALNNQENSEQSTEVMEVTRWGVYALSVAWGEFTYHTPSSFQIPESIDSPNVRMVEDETSWCFHRLLDDSGIHEQTSFVMVTATENARLLRIVHDTSNLYYNGYRSKVSAKEILQNYGHYLAWLHELPQELRVGDEIGKTLPHVLTLHIHYHTALTFLFRPLLHRHGFTWETHHHLRSITIDNAWKGLELLRRYRQNWTCRYQPPLQSFCILHLCDALLRYDTSSPGILEVVRFCMECLKEAADGRGGFAVCGPLQKAFSQTVIDCNVLSVDDMQEWLGDNKQLSADDMLDAIARLSYTQPVNQAVSHMSAAVPQDFAEEWRLFVENRGPERVEPSKGSKYLQISSLLNA